uniref:Alpha-(1,6)-fucosyltransferase N- and catalytic domain-containing protein n=1 Tax=Candidatus Kentrum sp. DK TaxID=2126562 RepID=A0A450SPZ8_9GAMM|nr:MAG: hypothetical protein BECKDK2373C_GA0170839_10522 [Candidatus Kentron sp. DK]
MNEKALQAYQKRNAGNTKNLIFHLTARGYASEINNMLLAILYCLVYRINFQLHSRSWNARASKGWQDYFLPFCPEVRNLSLINHSPWLTDMTSFERFLDEYYKMIFPNILLTHDIWNDMWSTDFVNRHFEFPEIGINGDVFHAKRILLQLIHRFNDDIVNEMKVKDRLKDEMNTYIGVHVRRGDKVTTGEGASFHAAEYSDLIREKYPECRQLFVATDDYAVITEFRNIFPEDYRIMTFCSQERIGHDQEHFNGKSKYERKKEMIDLFLDIRFLSDAKAFVGTFSSNIGRLIALFRDGKNCHSLDCEWHPY